MVGKPAAALLHGISHVPAPTSMAATICACWTLGITGTRTVEQAELRVALDEMRVGGGFERSVGVGLPGGVGEGLPLSPRAAVLAVQRTSRSPRRATSPSKSSSLYQA